MHWDVDGKSQKVMKEIAAAVKKADKLILATDPDREGEAISWHILRILEDKQGPEEGRPGRARHLQRRHQAVRARRVQGPAADRRAAGRGLSGPPRARLSRRLHAVAGAVAQAAGRPLGRPRAVGGAAARLRPRGRDRGLQDRGILDHRGAAGDAPRARSSRARLDGHRRQEARQARHQGRGLRHTPSRPPSRRATSASRRSRRRRCGATRTRRSPPRRCSRRPRASSASRPSRPCRSPSASTRASTSAARRSASSPTCEPTASRSSPRPSAPSASSIARDYSQALRAALHPRVQDQGQERPGGARGDPPDRRRAHARRMSRATSSATRRGSTS